MSIIYRKAELNDIPKLNPLLAQLSDAMADPQKMAEKMKKIAKIAIFKAKNTIEQHLVSNILC